VGGGQGGGPVLELFAVPDLFATGALEIEHLGGNVRVTFFVERKVGELTPAARVPIASIVMSAEDCLRIGQEMQMAGTPEAAGQVRTVPFLRRQHH
jgi:hypothetical protein